MAGLSLELSLAGDVQLRRSLLRFTTRIEDPRPVFRSIARFWMGLERQQFETEGRFASGGWQELAPSTIAAKGGDTSILFRTGDLMASLSEEGDEHMILDINRDLMVFGTSLEYARFHQKGEGVPQRRELELREQDRHESINRYQRYIVAGTLT